MAINWTILYWWNFDTHTMHVSSVSSMSVNDMHLSQKLLYNDIHLSRNSYQLKLNTSVQEEQEEECIKHQVQTTKNHAESNNLIHISQN